MSGAGGANSDTTRDGKLTTNKATNAQLPSTTRMPLARVVGALPVMRWPLSETDALPHGTMVVAVAVERRMACDRSIPTPCTTKWLGGTASARPMRATLGGGQGRV